MSAKTSASGSRAGRATVIAVSIATIVAVAGPSVTPVPAAAAPVGLSTATAPSYGGVLRVAALSDTDYLDPNISYYAIGYEYLRQFSRQLYTWPAVNGGSAAEVPDLATGMPRVARHGTVYRVTIRKGARWNTTPARQVTAADVVRGVKATCNPIQPFGGVFLFNTLLKGMRKFCANYSRIGTFSPHAVARYARQHALPGVQVGSNRRVVVFRLRHRANYFTDLLALPAFSPRPKELDAYFPGSTQESQHTVSDGPYEVARYRPAHAIVFVRNPAWNRRTDPVRAAYVRRIVVNFTDQAGAAVRAMRSSDPSVDMMIGAVPTHIAARRLARHDPNLVVRPWDATNPFVVFNTVSPNNHGALQKARVRRALSFAINRNRLITRLGGSDFNPPLTHALPPNIVGSRPFERYAYDPARAKTLLRKANARHLKLTFLYRPSSADSVAIFRSIRRHLGKVGVTVDGLAASDADFYTKYLEIPSRAQTGVWDMSITGWYSDWQHNAAFSFFGGLYDGRVLPPQSSNFGLFQDRHVERLMDQAKRAGLSRAARLWHRADERVMSQAPVFPIASPREPTYHASPVHGYVFVPAFTAGDMTNVWFDRN